MNLTPLTGRTLLFLNVNAWKNYRKHKIINIFLHPPHQQAYHHQQQHHYYLTYERVVVWSLCHWTSYQFHPKYLS